MAKKTEPKKLIIVESAGSIGELGGISGPILNPCYVSIPIINRMINKHRAVYEVNPSNFTEKVRLSLKNLRSENFNYNAPKTVNSPTTTTPAVVTNAVDVQDKKNDTIEKVENPKPLGDFIKN